jgi:methylated-DNA-[protein]-cysteine S-methyltransferase
VGELDATRDLQVRMDGTPFQRSVWDALRMLSAGSTLGYAALAVWIGKPGAARAVGHANGANPCSVVIPCHRLVGADGALTGYGGGLARKRWLLDHEAGHAATLRSRKQ